MPQTTDFYTIHTDGGSRGNPGPAATGVVIYSQNRQVLDRFGTYIGLATNNIAEYTAVLHALNWVQKHSNDLRLNPSHMILQFKLDSKLVVEQLSGRWKIKDPTLASLAAQIRSLITNHFPLTTFSHIPRSQNAAADQQVNLALDAASLLQ